MENLYPTGPADVPLELTKPTSKYKQRAWLAVLSLALFVAVYIALASWFSWTAYSMVLQAQAGGDNALWQWLIGISAAFLAVFMLKALFFVKHGGNPNVLELKAEDQPRLFEFLHRLADEAGAPRPKKVFVSSQVNAAVFYDLSLINLIFPSRKNLEIGLALVNVLTLSELKAVLAHEFGHFAQRSMAIGSWVYIAQQVATQVVSTRDALDKLLSFLSRIDLRIAWIGWLLSLVVWSIRSLMDTFLRLVVLAQRALSRQMEFQADLVAVSLTGSDELVHALHKLQAADDAWERTLQFAGAEVAQGRLPHDVFEVQQKIIEKLGTIFGDDSYGKVPQATGTKRQEHRVFTKAFAQAPQMWSTHPANADREENAKRHYISAAHDARSAWMLLDDVDALKSQAIAPIFKGADVERADARETLQALDKTFSRLQFEPRYRGAYLGRSLTRQVASPDELYDQALATAPIQQALSELYGADLSEDLARLRNLEDERQTLQALKDKVYRADNGQIVFRGRKISRRELPAAIQEVAEEEQGTREAIWAHDRRCRSAHLAAAGQLGKGYKEYLLGLLHLLHYSEHSLADLRDAHGVMNNVLAVVMADGKVTSKELDRLVSAGCTLRGVMARVCSEKEEVVLDEGIRKRLAVESWSGQLEDFQLPTPTRNNIRDWMGAVDGWVSSISGNLSALVSATLEQLLFTEEQLAVQLRSKAELPTAPLPSTVPGKYNTFLQGEERKRQTRLGLWDRFQTADGPFAAICRFATASLIVGSVLGFSAVVGSKLTLSIFNGLGQTVYVEVGDERYGLEPLSAKEVKVQRDKDITIETFTAGDNLVERFSAATDLRHSRYVYNIAGAAPLVEWRAVYGEASEVPPRMVGAPRWTTSTAHVVFAEPPESIESQGGGGFRTVLTAVVDGTPGERLDLVTKDVERTRLISAHAAWDSRDMLYTKDWQSLNERQ